MLLPFVRDADDESEYDTESRKYAKKPDQAFSSQCIAHSGVNVADRF